MQLDDSHKRPHLLSTDPAAVVPPAAKRPKLAHSPPVAAQAHPQSHTGSPQRRRNGGHTPARGKPRLRLSVNAQSNPAPHLPRSVGRRRDPHGVQLPIIFDPSATRRPTSGDPTHWTTERAMLSSDSPYYSEGEVSIATHSRSTNNLAFHYNRNGSLPEINKPRFTLRPVPQHEWRGGSSESLADLGISSDFSVSPVSPFAQGPSSAQFFSPNNAHSSSLGQPFIPGSGDLAAAPALAHQLAYTSKPMYRTSIAAGAPFASTSASPSYHSHSSVSSSPHELYTSQFGNYPDVGSYAGTTDIVSPAMTSLHTPSDVDASDQDALTSISTINAMDRRFSAASLLQGAFGEMYISPKAAAAVANNYDFSESRVASEGNLFAPEDMRMRQWIGARNAPSSVAVSTSQALPPLGTYPPVTFGAYQMAPQAGYGRKHFPVPVPMMASHAHGPIINHLAALPPPPSGFTHSSSSFTSYAHTPNYMPNPPPPSSFVANGSYLAPPSIAASPLALQLHQPRPQRPIPLISLPDDELERLALETTKPARTDTETGGHADGAPGSIETEAKPERSTLRPTSLLFQPVADAVRYQLR